MGDSIDWLKWFAGSPWAVLAGLIIGVAAVIYAAIPVHKARRQRKLENARSLPGAKAMVNRLPSVDGWRSMILHITPPPGQEQTFKYGQTGWRIESAKLLSPRNAVLAFARQDDHSLVGPVEGPAPRILEGRPKSHVQPFALEFFIKFPETPDTDQGAKARFRLKLRHTEDPNLRRTVKVLAEIPLDAPARRSAE